MIKRVQDGDPTTVYTAPTARSLLSRPLGYGPLGRPEARGTAYAVHPYDEVIKGALMSMRVWLFFSLIVALAACRSEPPSTVTYLDSAGVRHTISPDTLRTFADVDPDPALSLGGPDVMGPAQFFDVRSIHVDPGGNIWIADGGSGEVRIFRPDGSHWKTRGGKGEGPGEFRQPESMVIGPDGRIHVRSPRAGRAPRR